MKNTVKRLKALKQASKAGRRSKSEAAGVNATKIRQAALVTKAGMVRYPRELYASLREARNGHGPVTPAADVHEFESHDLAALWIGHATVLLRIGGVTILTDPVFSRRVGMTLGKVTMGVARITPPALDVDHLPHIDAVLLSHAHYDHLDRPSLQRLLAGPAKHAAIVTAMYTRKLIPRGACRLEEVAWDGLLEVESCRGKSGCGVRVRALRPAHWGARTALDRHRRFNAYVIEARGGAGKGARVLFAGDSAHTQAFEGAGAMDLSIFGIGAYDPWEAAHATPEQVWSMYLGMGAGQPHGRLLPMHHSTFALGREPIDEPMQRLRAAAGAHEDRLVAYKPGMLWTAEQPKGAATAA